MGKYLTLVVVSTMALAGLARGGDAKKDLETLQGTWKIDSIKESFAKAPAEETIKEFLVTVKDDTMKITRNSVATVAFKIKLDPTASPSKIDLTHTEGPDKGKTELGIYKFEGDTWTMCVTDIGKERPTMFATKEGTKNTLFVLKKTK
jgi:uncharacterized protein (TIGR03067 family)